MEWKVLQRFLTNKSNGKRISTWNSVCTCILYSGRCIENIFFKFLCYCADEYLQNPQSYAAGFAVYLPPYPNLLHLYKDTLPDIRYCRVSKITIYAPVIYTAPCIMFWMGAYTLRGEVGGGRALEFLSFLGPVKWERADRRVPFGAHKTWEFQGPTPSHFPE
jgi:hypothetical protein